MSHKTEQLRFIQYARKSSQGESRQVASLEDQEKTLCSVAGRENLKIYRRLSEARSTKAPGVRPVFREMLDLIESTPILLF